MQGKAKTKENTFEKATFHFTWDSHFIHMMDDVEPPHEADVVVLSIGSHQARNRWTTRTFRSMLDRHVKYFKGWSYTPRMLYITAPAKQPYNGDWRTHPRIASWSKLEVEVARKAGFDEMGFIRGFDTTLPFTRESPDG